MMTITAIVLLGVWLTYSVVASGRSMMADRAPEASGSTGPSPLPASLVAADNESSNSLQKRAARALARSPMDGRALFILGLASSAEGQERQASALIGRAAQLSLRDSRSHTWLFERAVERRQYPTAFFHADTLMRRSPTTASPLIWRIARTLDDPQARAALAALMAQNPPWRGQALLTMTRSGNAGDVAELLALMSKAPNPPSDEELSQFFIRLVGEGSQDKASRFWPALTGQPRRDAPPFVFNGSFSELKGPAPLNWQRLETPGGSASWTQENGRPSGELSLQHDSFSSSGPMVQQLIYLPPGPFFARARARITDQAADGRFRLEVGCYIGARLVTLPLQADVGGWRYSEAEFEVPGEGCTTQWLRVTPTTGERREMAQMWVDDIEVKAGRIIR